MAPTTPSNSSGHGSPEEQLRIVRRRNRVPLSCVPCRTRKLKCNRGTPSCENCMKRGDTQSCVYSSANNRRRAQASMGPNATTDDMQSRIDRLESILLAYVPKGAANIDASANSAAKSAAPPNTGSDERKGQGEYAMEDDADGDSDVDDGLATSLGVLKIDADKGRSMYFGQEHWHTLLADISEVKNFYAEHKKDVEKGFEKVISSKPASMLESPIFLLSAPPSTETELRAELPAKTTVTTLITRFFNHVDTADSVLHAPTFRRQLEEHWQDPNKSSITWVGMVYAMLTLALLSHHKVGDEPPECKGRSLELALEYRLRTVQCLVVADWSKPVEYTVETMILYMFGEYSSRFDADLGLWMIASLVTRVAFRMGYHRDAEWFPSISPFQGEMRRRVWAMIRMADIMFSYSVSLPTMIYDHQTDTKLPHNILDEEFGLDTKVLPQSRPTMDRTPISYFISKMKLGIEFGNILQTVGRVGKHVTYDEILDHDRKLRVVMDELPSHLKWQASGGLHDNAKELMAKFGINTLYQKIMCMLHRKHLIRARTNARYAHSRRSAIEASLQILCNLRTIHRECKPDGRLDSMRWYMEWIAKDSILPTMLVLLDLRHENRAAAPDGRQNRTIECFWTREQRDHMLSTLDDVKNIWKSLAKRSIEAYKAGLVLDLMLEKIKNPPPAGMWADASNRGNSFGNFGSADFKPEQSAAESLGMLSGGMAPNMPPPSAMYSPVDPAFGGGDFMSKFPADPMLGLNVAGSDFSMFNNFGGSGEMAGPNINWDAFESYSQNVTWGPDQASFPGFFPNGTEDPSTHGNVTDSSPSVYTPGGPWSGMST